VSSRVDGNARLAREQTFALEQVLQGVQSDLQKEVDERTAQTTKLDARIVEEHRFTEAAVAAEAKARDECIRLLDEETKLRLSEESRKLSVAIVKNAGAIQTLGEDVERDRILVLDQARETARNIAALRGMLSSEEQARQQGAWHLQQGIDLVREEVATEAKERRAQGNSLAEDVTLLQRGLQKRDDRTEALAKQLNSDTNDLRDRIIRETRLREAAVAQVEQQLSNIQSVRDGTPTSIAYPPQQGIMVNEWNEYRRQHDEDMERQRRSIVNLQTEQDALGKAMVNLDDKYDGLRTGLAACYSSVAEVQTRQKTLVEMELQVVATRDEMRREAVERKADDERLSTALSETNCRVERAEQARIKNESGICQDVLEAKNALKKEIRDRELTESRLAAFVREETQKREETIERECRLRTEADERVTDACHAAIRDERRVREKEDLRLEGRSLAVVGSKGGDLPDSREAAGLVMEQRALRQGFAELQDRLVNAEMRQKTAEERTVGMLDAIMSGLSTGA